MMSAIASRPKPSMGFYSTMPQSPVLQSCKDPAFGMAMRPAPSRTPSISSFKTNYSVSTAPTAYSPISPCSPCRPFDSFASLDKLSEPAFKRLPQDVYNGILDQLQYLHCAPRQTGCVTCFLRDLHALSLTCRAWERAVRPKLYNYICIIGNDSPAQLKKYRLKRGTRLKLLRRTLRERKSLANLVLEIRVPHIDSLFMAGKNSPQWQEYRDLVASVIMACPNLERLSGLTIPYSHEFDRLTHALSTRKKLKEHIWILGEAREIPEASPRSTSCPGSLGPMQMLEFLDCHASWTSLETLALYSLNDKSALEPSIFLRMFDLLPSLRNLCISSFNADAFDDSTLLCLPPLEALRLERLHGVTGAGLSQYTSRPDARYLRSLSMIELDIDSLLVISKILASLTHLERFKLVQVDKCPTLPLGGMVFQPLLASSSLRYLHWDVACPNPGTALGKLDFAPFVKPPKHIETPNSHLAQSILAAGFPRLETLRAPSDVEPPGVLQAVCRPVPNGQALLHLDRYSLPRSSHGSVTTRPLALPAGNNLISARIRAQTFIDMAAKDSETGMRVIVADYSDSYVPDNAVDTEAEDEMETWMDEYVTRSSRGKLEADSSLEGGDGPTSVFDFRMPAYMGRVGCSTNEDDIAIPRLMLRPDSPGQDADGGLVGWRHILASSQPLTYAAGAGANCFGQNGGGNFSLDEPPSPASTPTTSRFGFGNLGSRTVLAGPLTPTTPTIPTGYSATVPPWERDSCTGSWNHSHKGGKDWWFHMERDRPRVGEIIDLRQLF